MYKLTVEDLKNRSLELTNNETQWQIAEIDGLAPSDAEIETQELANWDGSVFVSSRVKSRDITISLYLNGEIETNRLTLYSFFKTKEYIKLIFETEKKKIYIDAYVEKIDINLFDEHQIMQISLICPSPFFVDTAEQKTELQKKQGAFTFPFAIDKDGVEFSTIETHRNVIVYNYGEVETGFIVEFSFLGSVKDIILYNTRTEKFIKINGTFSKGEIVKVNTTKGKRSVKKIEDIVETNLINSFDITSTWLQLASGNNIFTIRAVENEDNVIATFYNNTYYQGI